MPVTLDHVVDALAALGGQAHLGDIIERVRETAPRPLPDRLPAVVRRRLQDRCYEARGAKLDLPELFQSVYGVAAKRGVWRLVSDPLDPQNPDAVYDGADAFIDDEEGRLALRIHLRRERSRRLVTAFKASLQSLECSACGFDFETAYGVIGAGYIEAHHTIPVADLQEGARTRVADLVALCANCHRIIHRNGLMPVAELRSRLRNESFSLAL